MQPNHRFDAAESVESCDCVDCVWGSQRINIDQGVLVPRPVARCSEFAPRKTLRSDALGGA